MTTEDDFQRALDANPDDHQTRLVFADWLDERGDPRAEGYRALGLLRLCPFVDTASFWWTSLSASCCPASGVRGNGCSLPRDWFDLIDIAPSSDNFKPLGAPGAAGTRRAVEDAAATAFGKLPEQRRAELISADIGAGTSPARRRKRTSKK